MEGFAHIFEGVVDPRRSNATLHDLDGMPMIGPLPALSGGGGCADMERFGRAEEGFPRGFMRLAHGIPSRDAFTNPFNALDPGSLQRAMLRLAEGWAARLGGGVTAIDGKALRRSFSDAASRSPQHLVRAFASEARPVLGQMRVEGRSNGITAVPTLKGNRGAPYEDVKLHLDDPAQERIGGAIGTLTAATGAAGPAPPVSSATSTGSDIGTAGPGWRPSARWSPPAGPGSGRRPGPAATS